MNVLLRRKGTTFISYNQVFSYKKCNIMAEEKNKQKPDELQEEQLDDVNGGAINIRKFPRQQ